jgi:hypothetical protein
MSKNSCPKVVKFRHTWKKPNGAIVEKVQWCNYKQELNSSVISWDKARRGGKIH